MSEKLRPTTEDSICREHSRRKSFDFKQGEFCCPECATPRPESLEERARAFCNRHKCEGLEHFAYKTAAKAERTHIGNLAASFFAAHMTEQVTPELWNKFKEYIEHG